jgi:hypothetical protein
MSLMLKPLAPSLYWGGTFHLLDNAESSAERSAFLYRYVLDPGIARAQGCE